MAVTTQESVEYTQVYTTEPPDQLSTAEMGGVLQIAFATHDQSGAGDATSSVALFKLPPGRVRVLMPSSVFYVNWTTALAKLDVGWDAYTGRDGVAVAADVDGLLDGADVDTAGIVTGATLGATLLATGGTKVFESRDGVTIRASSTDTAIVAGDDLVGYIVYVHV